MAKNQLTVTEDELKEVGGIVDEVPESTEAPSEPETPQEEVPVEPETPEEVPETEEPETVDEVEPEVIPEEQPSRRETLRIQQLLKKYPDLNERVQEQAPLQRTDALDYNQLDAEPEVLKQLDDDRRASNQASYSEGLKRAEFLNWETSLKIDNPVVEKKYPILDKNSDQFHPAVADALNTMYLKMSGFDSRNRTVAANISYADFIESNMELVEEIAGRKNAQSVKNIARQTATTGLRPDGSSAKRMNLNQAPENMTEEELYAAIGQVPPKKIN